MLNEFKRKDWGEKTNWRGGGGRSRGDNARVKYLKLQTMKDSNSGFSVEEIQE